MEHQDAEHQYDVVVIGFGAAGLAAAVAAIEEVETLARSDASIAVLERATRADRGGNTRWSTATFKMKDARTLNDDFVEAFATRSEDAGAYVETLAVETPGTLEWLESKGMEFESFKVFITSDDPRVRPVGAGAAIIDVLGRHVEEATRGRFFGPTANLGLLVSVLYETAALRLIMDDEGAVAGVSVRTRDGRIQHLAAKAVVIASGGFEGNPEMMTRYVGFDVPPTSRGGANNRGEGIQMGLDVGAKPTGQFNLFHPLPADPRTTERRSGLMTFNAVMETVPYGILINSAGDRFTDEGGASMDHLYDIIGRAVQAQEGQRAYIVSDQKTLAIPDYHLAVARDKAFDPYESSTIEGLADIIGVDPGRLSSTVVGFNEAASGDVADFDPMAPDGLTTAAGYQPKKSNWARPLDEPPFFAYPVTCSGVLTFGGIGTNEHAQVVDMDDVPIPGLFAAGEAHGLYHHDYVGSTSVLRGLVFGRIAGRNAVAHALATGS